MRVFFSARHRYIARTKIVKYTIAALSARHRYIARTKIVKYTIAALVMSHIRGSNYTYRAVIA